MTENSKKVLAYLKENYGKKFLTAEVAQGAGVSNATVTGCVTGLVKKGYATREAATIKDAEGKDKEVKYISLTNSGMSYDPDAQVAAE